MNKKLNFVIIYDIYNFVIKANSVVVFHINILSLWTSDECAMTFCMIVQLWNTITPVIQSSTQQIVHHA